jgi:nucleobase:cation symporter-1, NCS1 family
MFVSPQTIRWLFLAKATIVPPAWLALLIWAFVKVPPKSGLFAQKAELNGSELSWAWLSALNNVLGNYATLGVNIPDFTVGHNLPYRVALVYVRRT